jgi:hypothetical protein
MIFKNEHLVLFFASIAVERANRRVDAEKTSILKFLIPLVFIAERLRVPPEIDRMLSTNETVRSGASAKIAWRRARPAIPAGEGFRLA